MLLILSHLITFILRISGVDQFDLKIHVLLANSGITDNPHMVTLLSGLLLSINLFLVVAIGYTENAKCILKKLWIFLVFSMLLIFVPKDIEQYTNFLFFLFVLIYFSKTIKPVLIGLAVMIIQLPYQLFIIWLKLGYIPFVEGLTFYQEITFNLDQYITLIVIYIILLYRKKVKT